VDLRGPERTWMGGPLGLGWKDLRGPERAWEDLRGPGWT
jgi:hypothetical protein